MSQFNKIYRERMALIEQTAKEYGGKISWTRRGIGAHHLVAIEGPDGAGLVGFSAGNSCPRTAQNLRAHIKQALHNRKKAKHDH